MAPDPAPSMLMARRGAIAAGLLIVVLGCLFVRWGWSDRVGLLTGDAPNYLMMAKSYADHGRDRVAAEVVAVSRFPPLYPLVLAWSAGATNLHAAHAVTCLFVVFALVAFAAWLRLCAAPWPLVLAALVVFAALPETWLAALMIQSEYLYACLSLGALALLVRYRRDRHENALFGAAILVVLAVLTRSIGIVLLAPLLVALQRATGRQRAFTAVIVLLPLAVWYGLHHARAGGGYLAALAGLLHGTLGLQAGSLRAGFAKALLLSPPYLQPIADILGAAGVTAALVRCIKFEPDGLYVCAYLALLMLWPYPGDAHRLLWPIVPILLVQPALVLLAVTAQRAARARTAGIAAAAVVILLPLSLSLPSIAHAWQRHGDPAAVQHPEFNTDPVWYWADRAEALHFVATEFALARALERVRTFVPENECVLSVRPDWVNFYADRRSEAPLPQNAPDETFATALRASGCHYVFMAPFIDRMYSEPMYPITRLRNPSLVDHSDTEDLAPGKRSEFILVTAEF